MKKAPSYRTRRRKIQNELEAFDYINTSNILETENLVRNTISTEIPLNYTPTELQISSPEVAYNAMDTNIVENLFVNNKEETIKQSLGQWAVDCNVPQSTVNKLLNILKFETPLTFLPKDCRTLLNTGSSKILNIRDVKPGKYYYFGLKNGIIKYSSILHLSEHIKIAVGVDGLPISKSSSGQLWPILAYIIPYHDCVFPVGIYYDFQKPLDSNDFLFDFISEILEITTNGITINNQLKKVTLEVMCCDVPAKSFLLRVKGHSGFFSCTRCTHEGEYINNRVCFPYNDIGHTKRNHNDYILKNNEEHHVSPIISCIALIPDINITSLFSLDYMHLVCLGVVKKLINLWMNNGPTSVSLSSWKVKQLSLNLEKIRSCITNDFARKPRRIEEYPRFKATEFRQLLLYTGPIVLKNVLSDDCYKHFMSLNISMRILLSNDHSEYLKYAAKLLNYFVKTFQQIYGCHYLSHNVHSLLHLVDDYITYGPLDNCSCFPFENYMKFLKRMLRKHEKPLEQIIKRYGEIIINDNIKFSNSKHNTFTIKKPDNFVLTTGGEIVQIIDILSNTSTIVGKKFNSKEDMFEKPISSSKLDIFIVKDLSENTKEWCISDIKKKIMIFNINEVLIAVPILK
ncbi:unnamed protein product [Macrosiphum euphorbiae]|uniref:DUF4806 domain-containing protein n=1 Tax=Macrosiphum euphorbiae TaxID=13131 RepID=A0AAV0YA57_9HEMI|nr:unnamed protein product [Macrosiphum euphorbiae]